MQNYRALRKRKNTFQLTKSLEHTLDLYEHLPFQIAVVSNLLQLNRDILIRNIVELDPRELRVILNIGSYMPIKAADIAYQARLDSYTVSRAVKALKAQGMIKTEQRENNKKVKYLVLTPEGEKVYAELVKVIDERTTQLEAVITDDEKSVLMSLLAKLEDQAELMLAERALNHNESELPADQKELIRWRKKST